MPFAVRNEGIADGVALARFGSPTNSDATSLQSQSQIRKPPVVVVLDMAKEWNAATVTLETHAGMRAVRCLLRRGTYFIDFLVFYTAIPGIQYV